MRTAGVWLAGVAVCALGAAAPSCARCARSGSALETATAAPLPDAEYVILPDAVFPQAAPGPRPVGRRGVPVMVDGVGVEPETVMGSPPSPEHPGGTIGVLVCKFQPKPDDTESFWCDLSLAEVDVATAKPVAQVALGDHVEKHVLLEGARGAMVWLDEGDQSVLVRFEGVRRITARQRIPALDRDPTLSPCGHMAVGDEVVLTTCGDERHPFIRSWTIDADGRVAAKHDCPGGWSRPSVHLLRGRVVITNLTRSESDEGSWACWFKPDEPRVATRYFPLGSGLVVERDDAFLLEAVRRDGKVIDVVTHKTNDDLRPVGARVEEAKEPPSAAKACPIDGWGDNDAARRIQGFAIVALYYCCGETGPSAVFICDPHADYL